METNRFSYLLLGALVTSCASSASTSPPADPIASSDGATSTVTGALALSSFPSAPTTVDAIDETGLKVQAGIDAQGGFRLALAKGHTYRLVVGLQSSSEPLVFPRTSSRLDTTVRVSTAAATIALGAVRHFDAAPAGGFTVKSASTATKPETENESEGDDGECVDGKDATSGAACVDDEVTATCDAGEAEDGPDEGDGDGDGETNDDGDADPTKPMAVPEHNAPDDVAGCSEGAGGEGPGGDGDGETNDD